MRSVFRLAPSSLVWMGGIGVNLQLPEGQVAELPAHMQQTLPDVEGKG